MTIYEQIQKSVESLEKNSRPEKERAARDAGMSVRSFTTWFEAVTGMSWREYTVRRRLEKAKEALETPGSRILDVAVSAGYQSHEAFTRAFRGEFGISPAEFRKCRPALKGLQKLDLIKEMYMGIVTKELKDMMVVCFDGFAPDSEDKAKAAYRDWKARHPETSKARRVFGHNIDLNGNQCGGDHAGYRLMVSIDSEAEADGLPVSKIGRGKFLVTGIEGNFRDDPEGAWITAGWTRMNRMIADKGLTVHPSPRWFEEELEPETAGNLRLDLYLEIGD